MSDDVPALAGKTERRGNVEVRLDESGNFDELVVYDNDGRIVVHLERMADGFIWLRAYGDAGDCVVHLESESPIKATREWEES